MRINDFAIGLVMALLGAVTIWASKDFAPLARQPYGAGTFPTLVGAFLVCLGLLLALRGWQQRGVLFVWQGQVALSRTFICLFAVIASVTGYALLTPLLGFLLVAPLMLTVLIGWLSCGRWALAFTVAIVASAVVWSVFALLLQVPLDLGVLEKAFY
ncbi:MAG: tripartite tricarboxylate transporter TctB family protein [Gammaproteobacteria bacterium]|nr:tripartite tricarboxylate transporter TctB family protein [Gammaproteobacteria bacterium]